MALLIHTLYWLHWGLDVLFFVAGMSVIFHPMLWARIYLTIFLAQQLILNGCLITKIENAVQGHAGWSTSPNRFIMAELFKGPVVDVYKALFAVIILWQLYYITKEIKQWAYRSKSLV